MVTTVDPLALLGERLVAERPALARRLANAVARELSESGARAVRREILRADRIAAEFAAGDVLSVDGWILARSEAAACAYLHRETR